MTICKLTQKVNYRRQREQQRNEQKQDACSMIYENAYRLRPMLLVASPSYQLYDDDTTTLNSFGTSAVDNTFIVNKDKKSFGEYKTRNARNHTRNTHNYSLTASLLPASGAHSKRIPKKAKHKKTLMHYNIDRINNTNERNMPCDDVSSMRIAYNTTIYLNLFSNEDSISDLDLLAYVLDFVAEGGESRELASELIAKFGSMGNVINARFSNITAIKNVTADVVRILAIIRAAGSRLSREQIIGRPIVDTWDHLIAYLRSKIGHLPIEQSRVLYLDKSNILISDELQQLGTIDSTMIYPREVARRAIELDSSAVILAHNHPSGRPKPSSSDIDMTKQIARSLEPLGIVLHDHIIITRSSYISFRQAGFLS